MPPRGLGLPQPGWKLDWSCETCIIGGRFASAKLCLRSRFFRPRMSPATASQLAIWISVLFALIVVAWIVVQRFRGGAASEGQVASDMLTKFQEMRQEGDISEKEYRTIKSVLGEQLQRDVKDGKNKG